MLPIRLFHISISGFLHQSVEFSVLTGTQSGNSISNQFGGHGFLLEFNAGLHSVSILYEIINDFTSPRSGSRKDSTGRWRYSAEVTSSFALD
jgi:hypothetical protein